MFSRFLGAALAVLFSFFLSCDSSDSSSTEDSESVIDLETELTTVGNFIDLPTSSGNQIQGKVVDEADDGFADGLDISGDGAANLVYIDGALDVSKPSLRQAGDTIAFYIAEDADQTEYYFIALRDSVGISDAINDSDEDVSDTSPITIVVETGSVLGFDTTGDLSADTATTVFTGFIIAYYKPLFTLENECFVGEWQVIDGFAGTSSLVLSDAGTFTLRTETAGTSGGYFYGEGTWEIIDNKFDLTITSDKISVVSAQDAEDNKEDTDPVLKSVVTAVCEEDQMVISNLLPSLTSYVLVTNSASSSDLLGLWEFQKLTYILDDSSSDYLLAAQSRATYEFRSSGQLETESIVYTYIQNDLTVNDPPVVAGPNTAYQLFDYDGTDFDYQDGCDSSFEGCSTVETFELPLIQDQIVLGPIYSKVE